LSARSRRLGALAAVPFAVAIGVGATGCETRRIEARAPTWEDDVAEVALERCGSCHGDALAEGGYRLDVYLSAIACPAGASMPAVEPPGEGAPLLAALERDDHRGLLDDQDAALFRAWVVGGAPARIGAAHPAGWIDPRSPDFHGAVLRGELWSRLLDATSTGSCAQCHAGAAPGGDPPHGTAPGATPCTSCHRDEGGPVACSTCHGTPGHPHPPRDPCFHPGELERGAAHRAHQAGGVGCDACHGARDVIGLGTSEHGDGLVQVALDPVRSGEGASFDPVTGTCATTCHARGGTLPVPAWTGSSASLDCASCHRTPPPEHWPGPCSGCHLEASAAGDALVALGAGPGGAVLHANGRVDVGDGSGGCGACHGRGEDPTPATGAHAMHAQPSIATPIGCESCHLVPRAVGDAGHLDASEGAEVIFSARASARGASPTYASGTCRDVACHGAGLGGGAIVAPRWDATDGSASQCGACHGLPPPPPHPVRTGCSTLGCHGAYATPGPGVSELGLGVHTDGTVDLWP
jgi:predicted CxxxxCH...CXXCH cytochrome family protein